MRWAIFVPVLAGALLVAACGRSPVAYGTANSIIATAPAEIWAEVEDTVHAVLEPRIFTVRDERTFDLTYASPASRDWTQLRKFRQLLVIGEAGDRWVEPVLDRHRGTVPAAPAIVEVEDVWARGQIVTVLLLSQGGGASEVVELLPALYRHVDDRFRSYVRERMFVSGEDTALESRLLGVAGFRLRLPQVYQHAVQDSVFLFRNDHPTAGRLERSVLVTWRPGTERAPSGDDALAWRDEVGAAYYEPGHVTERDRTLERRPDVHETEAVEVQGVWSSVPGAWPAAGPFITRVVACPEQDRTYILDAWLFAPREPKYEFMLQLETILDSFRCGPAGA